MTCVFPDCCAPVKVKKVSLCGSHYAQHSKGRELTAIVPHKKNRGKNRDNERNCYLCKRWLPFSEFYSEYTNLGGLSQRCKTCNTVKKYKLTAVTYTELLNKQDGKCLGCCRTPEEVSMVLLCVDHDHNCCPTPGKSCGNCNRGLLCRQCNTAIGQVGDSIETLQRLIEYLNTTSSLLNRSSNEQAEQ
jgi:hypothetical protein